MKKESRKEKQKEQADVFTLIYLCFERLRSIEQAVRTGSYDAILVFELSNRTVRFFWPTAKPFSPELEQSAT